MSLYSIFFGRDRRITFLIVSTDLSRRPERVLCGDVLDVVGERIVWQDVVGLVDAVHGVLEGQLSRRVLLVIFGRGRRKRGRLHPR